jgi:predicted HTH transcriptional regulator
MMSDQEKVIELLEELVKWTKVTSFPKVKEFLLSTLDSPEKMVAYQASNGEKTSREVAKIAKVTRRTITRWWKVWIKVGIAEPISVQRGERAKQFFSLDDFGIEVPTISLTTSDVGKNGGEEA